MRVYAQPGDLTAYTGQPAPADAERLLRDASRMLDAEVLRYCWYDVDPDGYPSNSTVRESVRDAVCAQVAWWGELGDSTGAAAAGWGSVSIGSVSLSGGAGGAGGGGQRPPARQVAPQAGDVLRSPDLTPSIFVLGVVTSC
ncbi:hypothetical protein DMB38_12770 [Streptomyces sp. WAC 06738]|uniref:hypothetical protein n=1 Tax=Streptomyces sp. WAC 06738 TaxID=2203210 RepID=UPI000F6BC2D0|nr:hypothetical protein [Streptomyces sp. WAC 06738]AZM46569.1 hypothetical protein DMB38_12770 [Streptomyces sp. WAC 06738]